MDDAETAFEACGPSKENAVRRMPTNIQRFAWLWAISGLIAFLEIPLLPAPAPDLMTSGVTLTELRIETAAFDCVLLAVLLPLFWLAVWRRKNWCRWVLLVFSIVAWGLEFHDPVFYFPDHLLLSILTFTSMALDIAAFFYVFTGDARPWFRQEGSN